MNKQILSRDIPEQVFSESFGAVYPTTISRQDDGKLAVGCDMCITRSLYRPDNRTTEIQRSMTVTKASAVITTIGQTALWTPAAGKRIRLMGFSVIVDPATTTVAGSLVTLQHGAVTVSNVVFIGVTVPTVPGRWAEMLPNNGLLLDLGEVLNVNLSAAATAGGVYLNAWGTEE